MSKKRSSWGEQEYVPAGNGDASGEYADESGSNRNFQNFEKPDKGETPGGAIDETPTKKGLKERLKLSADIEKEIKENYKHFLEYDISNDLAVEILTKDLLDGRFGYVDRSENQEEMGKGYADYYDDMKKWLEENKPEQFWYKKGNKWISTYYPEKQEYERMFTQEEYLEKSKQEIEKGLKQTSQEQKINKMCGDKCAVSFGKKYTEEYMDSIVESTEKVVNDFPELNGYIRAIGDRSAIENLSVARARASLTEENINKIAQDIIESGKNHNVNISIDVAKERAKNRLLKESLQLPRMGGNALGYWSPSHKALVMSPKTAETDADSTQIKSFEYNWHSSDKPMATYFHEFGHAVESMVFDIYSDKAETYRVDHPDKWKKFTALKEEFRNDLSKLQKENFSSKYKAEYVKLYNEIMGSNFESYDDLMNDSYSPQKNNAKNETSYQLKQKNIKKYAISEYGNTNQQEFFAECFSAAYTGMDNELANRVVERFKKFYNDIREF